MLLALALAGLAAASPAPPASPSASAARIAVPPAEAGARAALDRSPRHGEWMDIAAPGSPPIRAWIVYPERKEKAPVVLVIHEVCGLSDWIRAVADQLAADGFIAVAPDFLSGKGPGGGGSSSVASRDDVVTMIRGLDYTEVRTRLDVVRRWALDLPAASKAAATLGFCWGGARSFEYAAHQPELSAAVVFYGSSPADPEAYLHLEAPVLGLYGGDDARVNETIPGAREALKKLGKTYETEVYEGAGHGFLRQQDEREGANRRAAEAAWPRVLAFLRQHTR